MKHQRSSLGVSLILIICLTAGCGQFVFPFTFTPESETADPTEPNLQPSDPATETPVPTTSSSEPSETTQNNNHFAEPSAAVEIKQEAAPDLDGTQKTIKHIKGLERVVYIALPDNPYGLASGEIAGEYKHEVFIEDNQTGGVALKASLVNHLLQKALDEMPQQESRWLVTLPVDLSNCLSTRPVTIDLSAEPMIDRPYYIRITAEDETLGLVNILDASQQVVIEKFWIYDLHYVISQKSKDSRRIIEGEEMDFLFIIAPFLTDPASDPSYTYGDRVGMTKGPVLAGLTSVRGPFREHDYSCILKVDGCPVFIMANEIVP